MDTDSINLIIDQMDKELRKPIKEIIQIKRIEQNNFYGKTSLSYYTKTSIDDIIASKLKEAVESITVKYLKYVNIAFRENYFIISFYYLDFKEKVGENIEG